MKRSHDLLPFFELLPLVPQGSVDGREGKLFVNGDRFILKFSLLMMSFQAIKRLLKPIVPLLVVNRLTVKPFF